jgi:3-isopropylmalate/(R)-2-methylmalate dehydratase small subunit
MVIGANQMSDIISEVEGSGIVVRGNDIDTDRIIPARFMKQVTFTPLGQYVFYDARHDEEGNKKEHPFNEEQFKNASILVVNKNFGCGSSREHAPQSLMRWGIKAIIGESFAEIFAGNCTVMGVPTLMLTHKEVSALMDFIEKNPAGAITVDNEKQEINYGDKKVKATMHASSRTALLEGTWDSTSLLLESRGEIKNVASRLDYVSGYK